MNCEALIRSGEGEFLPLTLPHSTNTRGGEFQMIHGGDFRVMFDRTGARARGTARIRLHACHGMGGDLAAPADLDGRASAKLERGGPHRFRRSARFALQ